MGKISEMPKWLSQNKNQWRKKKTIGVYVSLGKNEWVKKENSGRG